MRRVTDFRIDVLEIPEEKFYELPEKAQKLIRMCGSPLKPTRPGYLRWDWGIDRSRELAEMLQNYEYELEDNARRLPAPDKGKRQLHALATSLGKSG